MSTQIRVSIDLILEKGDPLKVLKALQKPEISKQLNDFAAHVLVAEEIEGVKIRTVGGEAHECTPTPDYRCPVCTGQSKQWPKDTYPRPLLAR